MIKIKTIILTAIAIRIIAMIEVIMIHHHYEESVMDDIDKDYESNITEVDNNIVNEAVNFFQLFLMCLIIC